MNNTLRLVRIAKVRFADQSGLMVLITTLR